MNFSPITLNLHFVIATGVFVSHEFQVILCCPLISGFCLWIVAVNTL